jgi:hypothetical protein
MESLLVALPVLGCAVVMPAMMWLMSRGMKQGKTPTPRPSGDRPVDAGQADEIGQLRLDVDRLRSVLDSESRPSSPADV